MRKDCDLRDRKRRSRATDPRQMVTIDRWFFSSVCYPKADSAGLRAAETACFCRAPDLITICEAIRHRVSAKLLKTRRIRIDYLDRSQQPHRHGCMVAVLQQFSGSTGPGRTNLRRTGAGPFSPARMKRGGLEDEVECLPPWPACERVHLGGSGRSMGADGAIHVSRVPECGWRHPSLPPMRRQGFKTSRNGSRCS